MSKPPSRRLPLGLTLGLVLGLSACGGSSGSVPPGLSSDAFATGSPAGASPVVASPVVCSPDAGLAEVRGLLAGQTFEAHYLTIGALLTISIWLVDPTVDPAADQASVADGYDHALDTGLQIAYRVGRLACAGHAFAQVNPMIVDSSNQSWYIGFIPIDVVADLHDPTPAQLRAAVEQAGIAPARQRRLAPTPVGAAASGACSWSQARADIQSVLESGSANTAAYEIVGGGLPSLDPWNMGPLSDVDVEAQWVVDSESQTANPIVLERLSRLATILHCLSPVIDTLEVFIVDRSGQLLAYARVPGMLIRSGELPLPAGSVTIEHFGPAGASPS